MEMAITGNNSNYYQNNNKKDLNDDKILNKNTKKIHKSKKGIKLKY